MRSLKNTSPSQGRAPASVAPALVNVPAPVNVPALVNAPAPENVPARESDRVPGMITTV